MSEGRVHILGLGGSLRIGSWNRMLLEEAAGFASSAGIEIDLTKLDLVGTLPLFNQDLQTPGEIPSGVDELKDALRAADGLLIATPEYNWGIPGFLKNAIDWASRPNSDNPQVFGDLPVVVIGTGGASGTRNAQTAWISVFRYLKMRPWFGRYMFLDRARERFDDAGHLTDEMVRKELEMLVSEFAAHCVEQPRSRA
jgi:NAD(P)H-dependent FMN reductase